MWIVRLALRRPYTVAVMAVLIFLLGGLSLRAMIVDVFPVIDIPVVAVVWNYPGLPAEDMERRVVFISERAYSTTVGGIERIESQSIPGIGILRVYFQPGTEIGAAISQIASVSNTILRIAPPGMTPPSIIQFNASNVPVAQLTASSSTLSEDRIFDYGLNFIRIRLFTIPGLSTPAPFGGKSRQINVDIDTTTLAARGLSPSDIVNALQASNVILPAGTARMGGTDYNVFLNSSPTALEQFNQIPVRITGGAPILLGDVARVSDSFAEQTNIVRVNGRRATYLAILRKSDASTLAVVDAAREALPAIRAAAPDGLELRLDFDQSVFVRASIWGVVREALLASLLVSLMILAFLGSWRSVVIVCTSIPLSIFVSILGLYVTGQTINIMTLGGLSLAIGMLVDDATVEVENIHRNRHAGKALTVAILDGAQQIATPAIVATLAICIVFFPVALLRGPARYLFIPLALSVVFAMLASYVLSRTLVPTLARKLMAGEHLGGPDETARPGFWAWIDRQRERGFDRMQRIYSSMLNTVMHHRAFALLLALGVFAASATVPLVVGTDFFPEVDAGLMKLHVRAPSGMRLEHTEQLVARVDESIRRIIPASEISTINDMIGVPVSFNLAFTQTDNVSGMDAEVLISLRPEHHATRDYMRRIRATLPREFPGSSFYFQPADIVSQVINFGTSAPLDVQIEGRDLTVTGGIARRLREAIRQVPGAVDVHIVQTLDYPALQLDVDRVRAAQLGLTQRDVANSVLVSLATSSLVAPSYFINPANNVNYIVAVRIPMRRVDSVPSLLGIPLTPPSASAILQANETPLPASIPSPPSTTLGNISEVTPRTSPNQISHYTVQRVVDVAASVDGRDLGAVAADIERSIASLGRLPPGVGIHVRGQAEVMNRSFRSLGLGLVLAIALVYLLMVVLFQSWIDPFIIIMAVPGALVGIVWMLAITHTTINVTSLMGSIMSVGIAVANSILLVSFANDVRVERNIGPVEAALEAGKTRLRPVIMTAVAMILGMLPMALGMGEAGEQNAPLGRAVIGGLLVATLTTLFIVPVIYSVLRRNPPTSHALDRQFAAEARGALSSTEA